MRWLALLLFSFSLGTLYAQDYYVQSLPAVIIAEQAMHQWPDDLAEPLGTLALGASITLTGRDLRGAWFHAQTPSGSQGWLPLDAIGILPNLSLLPVQRLDYAELLDSVLFWNFGREMGWLYTYGLSLGNSSNRFAKIGDSITVSQNFLAPVGEGTYDLMGYSYLEATIRAYLSEGRANSFSRLSAAAGVGWTAAQLLQPAQNISCPDMTRLACEYLLHRPSVALITIGTNDLNYVNLEDYLANVRRVVEISFQMGVIPALSTLPEQIDKSLRVRVFNQALFALADEMDVPLWNYWLVSYNLPNRGLNADGVHPSAPPNRASAATFDAESLKYGYTMRNLMALQALYLLRANVMNLR
ncbi:MAG: SGNH/GDSL hydrolase family protein [Anaerolineae bacterium]|nr:SGNH/GDSL hydrolase family protein [Anaerolineae bacterium]MDW8172035.1 SGNH/GDSL hydrolase family protein [Anaerolineae bacterium]